MPEDPKTAGLPVTYVDHGAPFLFFEETPAFGAVNGVFRIVLTCGRPIPTDGGGVTVSAHVVAQLHGNREALMSLKAAIDGALLLGSPAEGLAN